MYILEYFFKDILREQMSSHAYSSLTLIEGYAQREGKLTWNLAGDLGELVAKV